MGALTGWPSPCPMLGSPTPGSTPKHRGDRDTQRTHPPNQHPPAASPAPPAQGLYIPLHPFNLPLCSYKCLPPQPEKRPAPQRERCCQGQDGAGVTGGCVTAGHGPRLPWGWQCHVPASPPVPSRHTGTGGCSAATHRARARENPGATSVPGDEGQGPGERCCGDQRSFIYATPRGK